MKRIAIIRLLNSRRWPTTKYPDKLFSESIWHEIDGELVANL